MLQWPMVLMYLRAYVLRYQKDGGIFQSKGPSEYFKRNGGGARHPLFSGGSSDNLALPQPAFLKNLCDNKHASVSDRESDGQDILCTRGWSGGQT